MARNLENVKQEDLMWVATNTTLEAGIKSKSVSGGGGMERKDLTCQQEVAYAKRK